MKHASMKVIGQPLTPWRRILLMVVFLMTVVVLIARSLDVQVLSSEFFVKQGHARQLRVVSIPAHRGQVVDRNGMPFAVSTPVSSVWVNPGEASADDAKIKELAKLLSIQSGVLRKKIRKNQSREFLYLKRHVSPEIAEKVMAVGMDGIALQDEYRRYYPLGEVAAHVIGFADIDDNGQEGIELAFDSWLKGVPGKKRIIRDRLGRAFADVEHLRTVEPGKPLMLSIDKRLQYLTYRTLKAAVLKHNAVGGSAVVLDVDTGEVLAMVNQPSFNVNDRSQLRPSATRNRSVTDVFEPGSTMKPLTMAAALESGRWQPHDKIDTAPGYMRVLGNTIRDTNNYGAIDVSGVIAKSSNVGISKIVLGIDADHQMSMYQKLGLGADTGSGFPGEVTGRLSVGAQHNDFERASLAFGYGVSVTPLQLARAYLALASDGMLRPVSFVYDGDSAESSYENGVRVMSASTAQAVRKMMRKVVSDDGTGRRAQVANYSVAGKTGTVHKFISGGYAEDRYLSIFAGMVPAGKPELVMAVMIDEPRNGEHFGGEVAAPVFSKVMAEAMRLLNITPDQIDSELLVTRNNNSHSEPLTARERT